MSPRQPGIEPAFGLSEAPEVTDAETIEIVPTVEPQVTSEKPVARQARMCVGA